MCRFAGGRVLRWGRAQCLPRMLEALGSFLNTKQKWTPAVGGQADMGIWPGLETKDVGGITWSIFGTGFRQGQWALLVPKSENTM